jgi:methionyl-tRNA formyltransferase
MLRLCSRNASQFGSKRTNRIEHVLRRRYSVTTDPVRILFFGSDTFSVASLKKLHETQKTEPRLYDSLEIVTREPSPGGRGLKRQKRTSWQVPLIAVPVQVYAETHDLPFHTVTRDSIKDIRASQFHANVLIAVSFGLFVPPRFISATNHTVNVHPSLLPQYRGPAPIHHAIYNGDKHTGVSLQTLSPDGFDRGTIFDQSYAIAIQDDEPFISLWDRLASIGADMLLSCIRNRTFRDPKPVHTFTTPSWAGYIHKQITWDNVTSEQAVRASRVHDPVTGAITLHDGKRVDILVRGLSIRQQNARKVPGTYFIAREALSGDKKMVIVCQNHQTIWVDQVKVSGKTWITGVEFINSAHHRFWGDQFVPWRKEFQDHSPEDFEY